MGWTNKSCLLRTTSIAVTGTIVHVPCCHSMSNDNDTRMGLLSGLFAVIMVVALSIMAMSALGGAPAQSTAGRGALGGELPDTARWVIDRP